MNCWKCMHTLSPAFRYAMTHILFLDIALTRLILENFVLKGLLLYAFPFKFVHR